MEVLAFKPSPSSSAQAERSQGKKSLQVRGLSYWAPAVIGPYSQAVMVSGIPLDLHLPLYLIHTLNIQANNFLFISGQIGLIPSSHSLPTPSSLSLEAALSLQHTKRIKETFKTMYSLSGDLHAAAWVVWADKEDNLVRATRCWRDSQQLGGEWLIIYSWKELMNGVVDGGMDLASPALFVVAETLPKSALVEVQATFFQAEEIDEEVDDDYAKLPRASLQLHSGQSLYSGVSSG
jgi:diphthine-ammonia ligase